MRIQIRKVPKGFILFFVFFVLAIAFLSVAAAMGLTESQTRRGCTVQTTATVIRLDTKNSSDSEGAAYAPVLMFAAADGETYTVCGSVYTNPCKYSRGDRVEIRYNPDKPEKFYIKGSIGLYIFSIIFGSIGGVFLAVCMIFVLVTIFAAKSAKPQKDTL